jgi:Na+-driven multidrug efflux pump
MALFSADPGVMETGGGYLLRVSGFYLIFSTMFIINGMLRGAGAAFIPMFSTFIALIAIRIPASYILSQSMGVAGIWWSIPMGWAAGCSLAAAYYLSGRWKKRVLVGPGARSEAGEGID